MKAAICRETSTRHREPRIGVAIQEIVWRPTFPWIAASAFGLLVMTRSNLFRKRFHEKGSTSPWLA